jgi:hypothetical protein
MGEQHQPRERARKLLQEKPEVEEALADCAVEAMEEYGMETSPEQISEFVLDMTIELMARAKHRARPLVAEVLTDEEVERIMDEEYERLYDSEIGGVDVAKLEAAAAKRMMQRFRSVFPHLPLGNEEEEGV